MKIMKNSFVKLSTFAFVALLGTSMMSAQIINDKIEVSTFPKAEKGMVQYVIEVPYGGMESDNNKRIEVMVGKYEEVDKCNRHFLNGKLEQKELKGWGYNYYEFKTDGNTMSTMMGCNDSSTVSKFITGESTMLSYNGRMPIVVYVPEGYEVKYKIYKAEDDVYHGLQVRSKSK